jgi:hypothetical protein
MLSGHLENSEVISALALNPSWGAANHLCGRWGGLHPMLAHGAGLD